MLGTWRDRLRHRKAELHGEKDYQLAQVRRLTEEIREQYDDMKALNPHSPAERAQRDKLYRKIQALKAERGKIFAILNEIDGALEDLNNELKETTQVPGT